MAAAPRDELFEREAFYISGWLALALWLAGVVTLSDSDRVKPVTNLLTVLVSETETQPVLSVSRD